MDFVGFPVERLAVQQLLIDAGFRVKVEDFAINEFNRQVAFIRYFLDAHEFEPTLRMSWRKDLTSEGGLCRNRKPYIDIAMGLVYRFLEDESQLYDEYEFIADDLGIGDETVSSWKLYFAFLIAHELAHVVELSDYTGPKARKLFKRNRVMMTVRDGHGKLWESIYRVLRDSARRQGIGNSRKGA